MRVFQLSYGANQPFYSTLVGDGTTRYVAQGVCVYVCVCACVCVCVCVCVCACKHLWSILGFSLQFSNTHVLSIRLLKDSAISQ